MKKAFTLIELLVVIAIIAILAAILFPVFTQAKAAAKSTASLSNIRQQGTAHLIYAHNADDRMVPAILYNASNAYLTRSGTPFASWGWNLYPYMKNGEIMSDPQTSGPTVPAGFNGSYYQAYYPQYGYNYALMSPSTTPYPATMAAPFQYVGRSQDELDRPGDMVMTSARNTLAEAVGGHWWYNSGTITTRDGIVEPVDCSNIIPWCFTNWGRNSFFSGSNFLNNNEVAGAYTGFTSLRKAGNAIVLFADGHAAGMAPGTLAVGTNWSRTIDAANIVTGDKTKSRWSNTGDFF